MTILVRPFSFIKMPSKKSKKKDKKLRLVKEKFNEKVPDGLNYGIAQNLPPDAVANVTGLSKEETNLLYETDTDSSKSRVLKKGKGISDAINLSNIDKKYLFPDKLINTGDISSFHVRSWMFEYNQLPPNERREVSDTLDFWKRAGDDKTEDDKSNISHLVAEPQSPSAPMDKPLALRVAHGGLAPAVHRLVWAQRDAGRHGLRCALLGCLRPGVCLRALST